MKQRNTLSKRTKRQSNKLIREDDNTDFEYWWLMTLIITLGTSLSYSILTTW